MTASMHVLMMCMVISDQQAKKLILEAMNMIEIATCVRFKTKQFIGDEESRSIPHVSFSSIGDRYMT